MNKISYFKMFDAEALYVQTNKKLFRLEDMNYDTSYFKMPKIFKNLIDQMFNHDTITYSDFGGFPRLKNLIINYEKLNSKINEKHSAPFVFVSNGVSSLLLGIIQSILMLEKNLTRREIIVFKPDYPLFESCIQMSGGKPLFIEGKVGNNFLVSTEQLEDIVVRNQGKISAICISNPHNPTCQTYDKEWIVKLIELSNKYDFFIISDEIYRETVYLDQDFSDIATIKQNYNNLIKLYGLSKDTPGMTGMRTGYCIGDMSIYENFLNLQLTHSFSNNIFADMCLLLDIALKYKKISGKKFFDLKYFSPKDQNDYYKNKNIFKIKQIKANNEVTLSLKQNKNVLDVIEPNCGNAIYFKYNECLKFDDVIIKFSEKGLLIYPTECFGADPDKNGTWLRVCVTKDPKIINKFIKKI